MNRTPKPLGSSLEELLDQRDHLQIQISLAADNPSGDADCLDQMHKQLWQLESQIAQQWRSRGSAFA